MRSANINLLGRRLRPSRPHNPPLHNRNYNLPPPVLPRNLVRHEHPRPGRGQPPLDPNRRDNIPHLARHRSVRARLRVQRAVKEFYHGLLGDRAWSCVGGIGDKSRQE